MSRYLGLIAEFFRISAIADLEYRANIAAKVFTDLLWYTAQLSVFEVLYRHTPMVAGWRLEEIRVFMGLLFMVDALWMLFFSENFDNLPEKVKKGDMDLVLAKPVSSQFMLTFQKVSTPFLVNLVLIAGFIGWALSRLPGGVPWVRLPTLLLSIPSAVIVIYCMRVFFTAGSLIYAQADSLTYVWYQIYRLGTRPDRMYPQWLKIAVLTVLPVGFIASVPARLVVDPFNGWLVAAPPLLAAALWFLAQRYWNFALRFYSSASS